MNPRSGDVFRGFLRAGLPGTLLLALWFGAENLVAQDAALTTGVLTLGDIDPDTPAKRIRKLQPFASHLEELMAPHGVNRVQIVIARNISEMTGRVADGSVDIYMDSPYPVLRIQEAAGGRLIAQRWVNQALEYHSVFFTANLRIRRLDQLRGEVISLQEAYSTSGYALPAAHLRQAGLSLTRLEAGASPAADEVGFIFSRDEENTVALVESGRVAAGAIASTDFDLLPEDRRGRLRVIDRTPSVPRMLVLVRNDLDAQLIRAIAASLLSIDQAAIAERAARAGDSNPWTWRFEPTPNDDSPGLVMVRRALPLLSQ